MNFFDQRMIRASIAFTLTAMSLAACSEHTYRAYAWGAFASNGNTLYVIQYKERSQANGLPLPEAPSPKIESEKYQIVAVDLRGGAAPVRTGTALHSSEQWGTAAAFDFVALDRAEPRIRGSAELTRQLRDSIGNACEGNLQYDEQDSRVLYLYCERESLAYRFEPPYSRGVPIKLGTPGGMKISMTGGYSFSSVLGDSKVYVWLGYDFLYEVDLEGRIAPVALNRFAGPEDAFRLKDVEGVEIGAHPYTGFEKLIGVSSNLRIHETARGGSRLEIAVVRDGIPVQRFAVQDSIANQELIERRYLPKSDLVIWVFGMHQGKVTIVSVDLKSGKFAQTVLPPA